MLTGLALLIGLLDVSDKIEVHLLGRQAAEVLVTRRYWAGVTQTVMVNDPSIPKSFECWNNDEGFNLYLDLLANKMTGRGLIGEDLLHLSSRGKYGRKPDGFRMIRVLFDVAEVPKVIEQAAEHYNP